MSVNTKQLKSLREACKGVCQLCKRRVKKLECDHDHETERARGFVCVPCNHYVIPAAEQIPELSHPRTLQYLANPPLLSYDIIYRNPPPKFPHFGNCTLSRREDVDDCRLVEWYKEVYHDGNRFAYVLTRQISVQPYKDETFIVYVDRKNQYRHSLAILDSGVGHERLMESILKNRLCPQLRSENIGEILFPDLPEKLKSCVCTR